MSRGRDGSGPKCPVTWHVTYLLFMIFWLGDALCLNIRLFNKSCCYQTTGSTFSGEEIIFLQMIDSVLQCYRQQ